MELGAFKKAAERTDSMTERYGVNAKWSLSPLGLCLVADYGANRVQRWLDWTEAESARDINALMQRHEEAALRGLST